MQPQEKKLEALGTIIADDGLTVLSLNTVDPTSNLLSRLRSPDASVQVNYTEVLILMKDGREIPAKFLLKDIDLVLLAERGTGGFKKLIIRCALGCLCCNWSFRWSRSISCAGSPGVDETAAIEECRELNGRGGCGFGGDNADYE